VLLTLLKNTIIFKTLFSVYFAKSTAKPRDYFNKKKDTDTVKNVLNVGR